MNNTIIVIVVGMICVAAITVIAVSLGHDDTLLAASISSIVGLASGFGAYNASKAKYPQWHETRVKKEEETSKTQT